MADIKKHVHEMLSEIKQERDTLQVKVHLAKLEASDEWHKLDAQLVKLEAKAKELGGASAEASQEIGAVAKLLGEEVVTGLKKIARHF